MHLPKGMLQHLRLWRHDPNKEKDTSGLFPLESSCLAVMFDKFRIHTVDGVQKSGEHHLGCIKLCRMKLSIKRPTGICRNSELYNVNNNIHFIDALFFYVLSLKKVFFPRHLNSSGPPPKKPFKKTNVSFTHESKPAMIREETTFIFCIQIQGEWQNTSPLSQRDAGDIPSRQAITYPTYEENHRTESQPLRGIC